jgi:hypothetical protein
MTAISTSSRLADSHSLLPGELIDSLIEAVVLAPDAQARAVRVCNLVDELCAAMKWLHGNETTLSDAAGIELRSLRQLVVAAQDHQQRMRTSFGADGPANGGPH